MGIGELVFTASRLGLGAVAAFLAIVLWSKTRDSAWMLMVIGTIAAYANTIYSILDSLGMVETSLALGNVPLASLVFPNIPTVFFILAFAVMIGRKGRSKG